MQIDNIGTVVSSLSLSGATTVDGPCTSHVHTSRVRVTHQSGYLLFFCTLAWKNQFPVLSIDYVNPTPRLRKPGWSVLVRLSARCGDAWFIVQQSVHFSVNAVRIEDLTPNTTVQVLSPVSYLVTMNPARRSFENRSPGDTFQRGGFRTRLINSIIYLCFRRREDTKTRSFAMIRAPIWKLANRD